MELRLIRDTFTEKSTMGRLYMGEFFECYTLEDKCRELIPGSWTSFTKVAKQTAIPYGTYEVIINYSDRFKRLMPLLINVPDFTGVRIHIGNTDKDTDGCILVGSLTTEDFVKQSQKAYDAFFGKLKSITEKEKVIIHVLKGTL